MSFVPTASGDLEDITLALYHRGGTDAYTVDLVEDAGGLPSFQWDDGWVAFNGHPLMAFRVTVVPEPEACAAIAGLGLLGLAAWLRMKAGWACRGRGFGRRIR